MATETNVDVTKLEFTPVMAQQCRRAGRNVPCPQGSGRKVKFCPCPVLHPAHEDDVPWDVEKTVGEDMAVFMLAPRFSDALPPAWENFTDGDAWPGSMQTLFTTKDQFTIARYVDWFLRAWPLPRYGGKTPAELFASERADRIGPAGRRAAAAYAASTPALVRTEEYVPGTRMVVTNLLTGTREEALLTSDMQMPEEIGVGWVLWSFYHTLNGMARVSPAAVALPPEGEATMLSAVREAVGDAPTTATLRAAFPALVRRGAALRKEIDDATGPKWRHAVYTTDAQETVVKLLTANDLFTPYEGAMEFPRATTAFAWPITDGAGDDTTGERFVAIGAGRVVLAATGSDLLARSRPELEGELSGLATFLAESTESAATLLRRSWKPGTAETEPEAAGGVDEQTEDAMETKSEATGNAGKQIGDNEDDGAHDVTPEGAPLTPAAAIDETEDPDADPNA